MINTTEFNYGVQDGITCKTRNRFSNGIDKMTGKYITLDEWLNNHFNPSYAAGFKEGYNK